MGAGPGRLIRGFERPPIGGSGRAEELGILIGLLPVHKAIDDRCPARPILADRPGVGVRARVGGRAGSGGGQRGEAGRGQYGSLLTAPWSRLRPLVLAPRAAAGHGQPSSG